MMTKLQEKFQDYSAYHTSSKNCYTHYIGIPLIVISVLGLLAQWTPISSYQPIAVWSVNGGTIATLIAFFYYLTQSPKMAVYFLPVLVLMYWIGFQMPLSILIIFQVIGWISQYVGHLVYEKKSPAFYKNLQHLLIGPIWIFSKITGLK